MEGEGRGEEGEEKGQYPSLLSLPPYFSPLVGNLKVTRFLIDYPKRLGICTEGVLYFCFYVEISCVSINVSI